MTQSYPVEQPLAISSMGRGASPIDSALTPYPPTLYASPSAVDPTTLTSNASPPGREGVATKNLPVILAPPSIIPSSSATASPNSQRTYSASSNTQDNSADIPLTDEEVDFVNSLRRNNVPAADIARVMQGMRIPGGQASGGGETSNGRDADIAPPNYDDVN